TPDENCGAKLFADVHDVLGDITVSRTMDRRGLTGALPGLARANHQQGITGDDGQDKDDETARKQQRIAGMGKQHQDRCG
ncbi:hypothetical protein, partial [Rhizobium leguminosarum]|uniref:hypothetical protein n=1 Tax=Rhizobium leguminosarum TaxID=384 RepID=UPI003F9502BC